MGPFLRGTESHGNVTGTRPLKANTEHESLSESRHTCDRISVHRASMSKTASSAWGLGFRVCGLVYEVLGLGLGFGVRDLGTPQARAGKRSSINCMPCHRNC